uniref:Shieldin complex subunit 2 C-terminal domain-containing protein n=1 Tax=Mola mola TaxID=94237 RepID=A0A3Q3WDA1_MOLML
IVTVEQPESQQGALVLWGAAVDWLPRFTKNTVWDFHILLVRECLTAELPELHSTPWSSVQPLDPASRRAKDFLKLCTPLDSIVEVLCGDITYTGCGRCSAELDTDANGIYVQCYPCLPHTTVRPLRVCVCSIYNFFFTCVRLAAPGSDVKHIQVAAERIRTVLSLPRKTFILTIRSHFLCDENSVPLRQDFTLLDLQQCPDEVKNVF